MHNLPYTQFLLKKKTVFCAPYNAAEFYAANKQFLHVLYLYIFHQLLNNTTLQ